MAGPIELIEQATAHAEKIMRGVKPEQFGNDTPCAEYDVKALLGHVFTGAEMMTTAAATGTAEMKDIPVGDNPGTQYAAARQKLLGAWKAPGVLEKTLTLPFGAMPGQMVAGILFMEALIHAWDVAKATGQDANVPEDLAKACLDQMRPMGGMLRGPGVFGPEIECPAGASATDQLASFAGRKP